MLYTEFVFITISQYLEINNQMPYDHQSKYCAKYVKLLQYKSIYHAIESYIFLCSDCRLFWNES